jgi:ribosomal protein S18 acetylase RimI-like enzyme
MPTTDLIIREATENDLPGVLSVYAQTGIDQGQSCTIEEAREHYKRFQSYPNYRLFVATIAEMVAGTYALMVMDNLAKRGKPSAIVEDIAVLPEYQRQGIGKAMLTHARELAVQAGCYKLVLSSNLRNQTAHGFYEKLGFEKHGYSFLCVIER